MSYDIYIGNAELESEWPGEDGQPIAEWTVHGMTRDDAPDKPDMTGKGNSCHPGYSQWTEAMRTVGLYEAFFADYTGLLYRHPGCVVLTEAHLKTFEKAQADYVAAHPDQKPGLCRCAECDVFNHDRGRESGPHDPTLNFNMMRLEWLVWWTRWALKNCERPAMSNT